jgi:hypothetical protein
MYPSPTTATETRDTGVRADSGDLDALDTF